MGHIRVWRFFWSALLSGAVLIGLTACQGYGTLSPIGVGKDEVPDPIREPGDRTRRLSWQEPFQRTDNTCLPRSEMGGVRVFLAEAPGAYDSSAPYLELPIGQYDCQEVGEDARCGALFECSHELTELDPGLWYISMKAYDTGNRASPFSNEASTLVE